MKFPQSRRTRNLVAIIMAAWVTLAGCANEPSKDRASVSDLEKQQAGREISNAFRVHTVWLRANRQRQMSVSARDDLGNRYFSTIRIVDVNDQATRLAEHLLGQIVQAPKATPNKLEEVTFYADGFEEIESMLWHGGSLHVIHGPNYSVLTQRGGAESRHERLDLSLIERVTPCRHKPSSAEAEPLFALLADRTKSTEARIAALWKLRAMTVDWFEPGRRPRQMPPPAFDPTKAVITALHNGPDALRAQAARVLRVLPNDTRSAIKGLSHRARNDTNAAVRMEAALTLGYLHASDAVAELLGSLNDPDENARMAKIMAIRMINQWELAPAFLNAADERTREGTLIALRDVHTKDGIEALIFAVQSSPHPAIRLQAIGMLALAAVDVKLVDTAFLQAGIQSTDPRSRALDLPMWLVGRSNSLQWDLIEETLRAATLEEEASVRTAAAVGLGFIRSNKILRGP